jgi:2-polyprenyl-6-methoxyphenol hydroxylase-like FAD-dependent oxidoreductase
MHTGERTEVLIIGAGPVGLAAAIELGHRSIPCILVERNDRVGYAPRAKTTNVRTREHLRRWGIADRLRDASPLGVDYPSDVHFVTRLCGHRLATIENSFFCKPGRHPAYAEHGQWIPQYLLEDVLRKHAEGLRGVELRFSTECLSLEQDSERVRTRIRDLTGSGETVIDSRYLVGCDGARSIVRSAIGAQMQGQYGLSRNYNVVFRAPGMAQAHCHGPGIMYWQINSDMPSLIGPMDLGDKWFFMPTGIGERFKLSDRDAASLIAKSTGLERDYQILSSDEWVASCLMADCYRDRRVFLAGDACHLHPPFGGYGMNMGIADAVDLGWKIAASLQGWGGDRLLDSYDAERRPVHRFVMDEAVTNHSVLGNQLLAPGVEGDGEAGASIREEIGRRIHATKAREFRSLAVVLGYRYEPSPVIAGEDDQAPAIDPLNYVPSARPGARAPHVWLEGGGALYDKFGLGFTLLGLRGSDPAILADALRTAAEGGMPLTIVAEDSLELAELYRARYVLVRPDQHVAWRGCTWPDQAIALLNHVSGRDRPAL